MKYGRLPTPLVPLALVLTLVGCGFDAAQLGAKRGCVGDSDCTDGRVCACGTCVAADEADSCEATDAGGDVSREPDTGEDATSDAQPDTMLEDTEPADTADGGSDADCPGNEQNVCGGCEDLDQVPGEDCGCNDEGEVACDGPDEVQCVGAAQVNACGGCTPLDFPPGDPCGMCSLGVYECSDDRQSLRCTEPDGRNACGGCGELADQPGEACEACGSGTWTCLQEQLVCMGDDNNACGGCATLVGNLGDVCGVCSGGALVCAGDGEALVCDIPDSSNGCGGCDTLPFPPGDACGVCGRGVAECSGDNATVCTGDIQNACGGCTALSAPPGNACGCSQGADITEVLVCDGPDDVMCVDQLGASDSPIDLGSRGAGDDWRTANSFLHTTIDEDWFTFTASDEIGELAPEFTLEGDRDYALCAYYRWDNNADRDPGCTIGTPADFNGLGGCCSDVTGTDGEHVELDVEGFLRNDTGRVWIRVFTNRNTDPSCVPYALRYRP